MQQPEQPQPQQPQSPARRMVKPDPEFAINVLRAERDGLASCLGRVQLELAESQELNHALKRDLAEAQATVAILTQQARERMAGPAKPPRKRGRPPKGNGKAKATKPGPVEAATANPGNGKG